MSTPTQSQTLSQADPELHNLIQHEQKRQFEGLELIASENLTSRAVSEALGSCLTNKYSEGQPGARYYGGNEYIDQVENLCRSRALAAYSLDPEEWGVNVQPYSGSPANFAVLTAVLQPHDRLMGLDLPSGGHLTHGYYTPKRKISATSIYFESFPYTVDKETGLIDYEELEKTATIFRPKLIICGGSAYAREWDYAKFRAIADKVGALLMMDMAHISGLVATKVLNDPFPHVDIVTTTTHKTLRGPRAGMIFFNKKHALGLENKINFAVFPSLQGGPHNHQIAAIATQLREVMTPEFVEYSHQVVKNCKALGEALTKSGHKLVTGGTDNHLLLVDLRPHGVTGSKVEAMCDCVSITLNKNAVPGDYNAFSPGGIRIGTPALTSRGMKEADVVHVAAFLDRCIQLTISIQDSMEGKKLVDFKKAMSASADVAALREEVHTFARGFYMPGWDPKDITV